MPPFLPIEQGTVRTCFIRLLWGQSELRSKGPDCAQPTPGAHANCVAAGDSSIMVFYLWLCSKPLQTVVEALEKPGPSGKGGEQGNDTLSFLLPGDQGSLTIVTLSGPHIFRALLLRPAM